MSSLQLKYLALPSTVLLLCLGFALPRLYTVWQLRQHGLYVEATVVGHHHDYVGSICTGVSFHDQSGATRTARLESCSLNPPAIGSKVSLRYLPRHPEVTTSSGDDAYLWPLFAMVLGIVFFWFHLPLRRARDKANGGI